MKEFLISLIPTMQEKILLGIGGVLGTVYAYFFKDVQEAFLWFCGFVLLDYITGAWGACKNGEWSSKKGARGIMKKVLLVCIIAMGRGLDVVCGTGFIQSAIIGSLAINEFGSIIENLYYCGYSGLIPQKLQEFLAELKNRPIKGS